MTTIESLEGRMLLAVIAMFDDPQYVVSLGTTEDASKNLRAELEADGHEVRSLSSLWPFATDPATALAGVDVLLLPKITYADIRAPFLLNDGLDALKSFVEGGGSILSVGNQRGYLYNTALLNDVFDWNIDFQYYDPTRQTIGIDSAAAAGTTFAGGPATLAKNTGTFMLSVNYPAGTKVIYRYSEGEPAVTRTTVGSGVVTQLAWNWNNASPLGTQDGGWNEVLRRAVADAVAATPTPSTSADGTLRVTGTGSDDSIVVTSEKIGGKWHVIVNMNGRTESFLANEARRIEVDAGSGNDRVDCSSMSAPCAIQGGGGNDYITGGTANDTLSGNAGKDSLHGSDGDDRLNGHGGPDKLYGDAGADRLYGGEQDDYLNAGGNGGRLWGDDGNDTLIGGSSKDRLVGGLGDDLLDGGRAADVLDGGAGEDTAKNDDADVRTLIEILVA